MQESRKIWYHGIVDEIRTKQMRWYGHVQRIPEARLSKQWSGSIKVEERMGDPGKAGQRKSIEICEKWVLINREKYASDYPNDNS